MPRNLLRRHLPSAASLREHPALRPLGSWLTNPELWHLHRRAVAGAAFIGLFCMFLPMPFQMIPAALLAIAARCNLPVSVALVWISNPITMGPMFYFAYRLGAWLLDVRLEVHTIELNLAWLAGYAGQIGYPLLVGCLLCGWVCGLTGFAFVHLGWRWSVARQWRARRAARRLRSTPREAA
jgi:uncharacterized protein (DUF2062 family)